MPVSTNMQQKFREAFKEFIMKYICPVCGYDDLEQSPYNHEKWGSFEICICCNFEFGVDEFDNLKKPYTMLTKDDFKEIHRDYRANWIQNGCKVYHPEFYPDDLMENGKVKITQVLKQLNNIDEGLIHKGL